jgi:Family of unknown function (DUF6502)
MCYDIFTMKMNSDFTLQRQGFLLATLRKVLKPFVRLLLAHGITYTQMLEELKRAFVQVADEEFVINGKRQTDSRITLLTGVHRKDVHRIRDEHEPDNAPKTSFNAQIIAKWLGDSRFQDDEGQPKALSRLNVEGDESFESLVASVSKDFRARPVYDEWLKQGLIRQLEDGKVSLNSEAFIPKQDLEQQLFYLGMNIHDHMAATVHNVTVEEPKMLERCVYEEGFTAAQIDKIHLQVKQNGMKFLKSINQTAIGIKNADEVALESEPTYRMNTGVYFYYEPVTEKQA